MNKLMICLAMTFVAALKAQVYSPKLLRSGQPDSTDLKKFSETICAQAKATTERERAEAIWRFFLTDGRFVKPGFWYHIAGWTYEEPSGEVLDPIKLLNSYGFGLCYHIAPLLQAVFRAAGFKDTRCWFLTGHTVTEVFYEGAYHYFDSDMMGYTVKGVGPYRKKPVVSVRDLELDPQIILEKLSAPNRVKPGVTDEPWYPADVRASAMKGLADLFSSTSDNYLYPYDRYSEGHSMEFELRPGETLTRFFKPEEPGLYYLPYRFDGAAWREFPQEIAEYKIRTADGPRSQKDPRSWATGRFDYKPPAITDDVTFISMPSPYVIIDASFSMNAKLENGRAVRVDTSTDNGRSWKLAGKLTGNHTGKWIVEPAVIFKTAHGRLTAVSGSYNYQVRITKSPAASIDSLQLTSRVQLNPRSLPCLSSGQNSFIYTSGPAVKRVELGELMSQAELHNMVRVEEAGQVFFLPVPGAGDATYRIAAPNGEMTGFDIGARFLEIKDGLAPDKLTAETRATRVKADAGDASIEWATSLDGPFHKVWNNRDTLTWLDGDRIQRLLKWRQAFQQVRNLPTGATEIFVRFRSSGPAIDDVRIATYSKSSGASKMTITQAWLDGKGSHRHVESIGPYTSNRRYSIEAGNLIENEYVKFSAGQ